MSLFPRKSSLHLTLTTQQWVLTQRRTDMPDLPLGQGTLPHPRHAHEQSIRVTDTEIAKTLGKHKGEVHITLDDTWVRSFLVQPPANVGRLSDLMLCARLRFENLYDEPETAWEVHADWRADRTFVACAIRHDLVNTLRGLSQEPSRRVVSILPSWLASWNAHPENTYPGWWAIGNAQSLVFLLQGEHGPLDLRSLSFASAPHSTTLDSAVAQESSRLRVLHATHHANLTPTALRWLGTASWMPHRGTAV